MNAFLPQNFSQYQKSKIAVPTSPSCSPRFIYPITLNVVSPCSLTDTIWISCSLHKFRMSYPSESAKLNTSDSASCSDYNSTIRLPVQRKRSSCLICHIGSSSFAIPSKIPLLSKTFPDASNSCSIVRS